MKYFITALLASTLNLLSVATYANANEEAENADAEEMAQQYVEQAEGLAEEARENADADKNEAESEG